jgi:hypothetical protein
MFSANSVTERQIDPAIIVRDAIHLSFAPTILGAFPRGLLPNLTT